MNNLEKLKKLRESWIEQGGNNSLFDRVTSALLEIKIEELEAKEPCKHNGHIYKNKFNQTICSNCESVLAKPVEESLKPLISITSSGIIFHGKNEVDWQFECKTITKQHDEALIQIKALDNYINELKNKNVEIIEFSDTQGIIIANLKKSRDHFEALSEQRLDAINYLQKQTPSVYAEMYLKQKEKNIVLINDIDKLKKANEKLNIKINNYKHLMSDYVQAEEKEGEK